MISLKKKHNIEPEQVVFSLFLESLVELTLLSILFVKKTPFRKSIMTNKHLIFQNAFSGFILLSIMILAIAPKNNFFEDLMDFLFQVILQDQVP